MSQTKKFKLGIILLLAVLSAFMFACKKTTPVQDVYFDLKGDEQIVLLVGEELSMSDRVVVKPAYATNKGYSISSFNEEVIKVENNTLIAVGEGYTQIKVVASDNSLKQDVMTVLVEKETRTLSAPKNLRYNEQTQSFEFDSVKDATSYTLNINGADYNLGNTTEFNLSQYNGVKHNELLTAKVKANAPTYTHALLGSSYCEAAKVYLAGGVENISVISGALRFDKSNEGLESKIFIEDKVLVERSSKTSFMLNILDEEYAGKNIQLGVKAIVTSEIRAQYDDDVQFYDSEIQTININVLDVPEIRLTSTTLTWQNVAHCLSYMLVVDGTEIVPTSNNYFDLKTLWNFDSLIDSSSVHEIRIDPILDYDSTSLGKTSKTNSLKIKRLDPVQITCDGPNVSWVANANASVYSVTLIGEEVNLTSSIGLNYLPMKGYKPGEYSIAVQSIAKEVADENGVYYISSQTSTKAFTKVEGFTKNVNVSLNDYKLTINSLVQDEYAEVTFDVEEYNRTIKGDGSAKIINFLEPEFDFAPGYHKISVVRKGGENEVDSSSLDFDFIQLDQVQNVQMVNGRIIVSEGVYNKTATINIEIDGAAIPDTILAEGLRYDCNTTDENKKELLPSGNYTVNVFALGDGQSTFSYMENGNPISAGNLSFTVLPAPTLSLMDSAITKITIGEVNSASSYDVYYVEGEEKRFKENVKVTEFDFELETGSVSFAVQAKGDKSNYLDSIPSSPIVVNRLKTPTLVYNNKTQVITKGYVNDDGVFEIKNDAHAKQYVFKHDGNVVDYDFASAFVLETASVLTLQAIAVAGDGVNYYLNSHEFLLELNRIINDATIALDPLNRLIITPVEHTQRYGLYVEFTFTSGKQTFASVGDVLTDGNYTIPFNYSDGVYTIDLVDENHNAYVEGLKNNFGVEFKFTRISEDENLIDSPLSNKETFGLIRISNDTEISVNTNNQIVIKPAQHEQEYGLVVFINGGVEMTFVSTGTKLVEEDVELNYSYNATEKAYYVNILNNDFTPTIEGLTNNFKIKVKYSYNHNGVQSDLDSSYCEEKTIEVLPAATISREGQTLKITNVKPTYTYNNYGLFINNNYLLALDEEIEVVEDSLVVDINYIYEKTPNAYLQQVNSVCAVVLNIDTSEETPVLSTRGNIIYVEKAAALELKSVKYNNNEDGNNNNSVVVSFETYSSEFEKQYVVELFNNAGENKLVKRYIDDNAKNGNISFNMDDITELEGVIYIVAYVSTTGSYVDENVVNVFNSNNSNRIALERIVKADGLTVTNSTLKFSSVENAVGYEIYEKTNAGYVKLNESLLQTNSYTITNFVGKKQLVVKAISVVGGHTNSNYSDIITINKLANPTVEVRDGKFNITMANETLALMSNEKIKVIPEVTDSLKRKISINLNSLDNVSATLIGTTLIAEPYLFLNYNSESLLAEDLSVKIRVEYTEAIDGVYYLNSNSVDISAYGLFKPTQVSKTTNNNDTVELITWEASKNNILNGNTLLVGYIFSIEYSGKTYYSNDTSLKYFDTSRKEYVSYASMITANSAVFPAGYDENNDGVLDIAFVEGLYSVSVQTVPASSVSGYNICSSEYTSTYEFEILPKNTLTMSGGKIVWTNQEKASKYLVSIYEGEEVDPTLVDTVTVSEYDFTNASLNTLSGVYRVIVKSISTRDDALNSEDSNPFYVYRLPEVSDVSIEDGQLILSATKYFDFAEIEFIDNATKLSCVEEYDNTKISAEALKTLGVSTWKGFIDDAEINKTAKVAINLDGEALGILAGRDYTINIKLIGNSKTETGFITSSKVTTVSNMLATKLKPIVTEISLGVVQFMPDGDYATVDKSGVYTGLDFNYSFNGATSSIFWNNTAVYKIELTYSDGVVYIYAVDYYSFITAVNNGKIQANEYELLTNSNGLHAYVKYNYTVVDEEMGKEVDKVLYFNVYENNTINLRDYDYLRYYPIEEVMTDGVNSLSGGTEQVVISLAEGGSFTINIYMLGGDSVPYKEQIVGHLSSNASEIKTFVRYGTNQLSSHEGKIQFNNLLPIVKDKTIDNPVYKIVVTALNSDDSQIFYIYHTTEEDAKTVAERHDVTTSATATYVQVEKDEKTEEVLYFDLSKYITDGTYNISIRTLAGLGTGEDDADYLLNAKEPGVEYSFYKLTDTKFVANNGVLEFEQSYIVRGSNKIYVESYEITLYDVEADKEFTYQINREDSNVTIDVLSHKVKYVLPAQIVLDNGSVRIDGNKEFKIKIRAVAKDNQVLNGTYAKKDLEDVVLTFKKSQGISETEGEDLRIENGILKWKVLDLDNYVSTIIKISFKDENDQVKHLYITVGTENRVDVNGVYQYHYYEFTDEKYDLSTSGSVYINSDTTYMINVYTKGRTTSTNILDSNLSSELTASRLKTIDSATIQTQDGVLVWEEIEHANSYLVTIIGARKYEIETEANSLNMLTSELNLPVGTYSVTVKANGTDKLNSMVSSLVTEFKQLGTVDIASIRIEDSNIVWDAVENADGYKVEFEYSNAQGKQKETIIVSTNSYLAPMGVTGQFSISISAVGVGYGKTFNGKKVDYTSSSDAPAQVEKFEFDNVNNRFAIQVDNDNFLASDKLVIVYNFAEYIGHNELSKPKLVTETINYQQAGRFSLISEGITEYYLPIIVMGQYTDLYVQIIRPATLPSNAVQTDSVDFNLFSYGGGTQENPYRIFNATHLLNVKYFTSAHYTLTASINMSSVDVAERLGEFNAVIAETFSGTFDGANFSIFGFNVDVEQKTDTIVLNDVTNFALFKTLNNATIKNLTIGQENIQLILLNTFANNNANMINLSLIATGANNSIIEKVNILNSKVVLTTTSNTQKSNGSIYVAGLVKDATNTTITNSAINLVVDIDMYLAESVNVYVGGVVAQATNSNITDCKNITFGLTTKEDNLLSYVGGVVAYYIGNASKTTGITNSNVHFSVANVQSIHIGGLIGFARNVKIDSSETTGTYSQQNIGYYTYIGGLVGYAQSSTIQNSGSFMIINVTLSNNNGDKFIGAIAGMLSVQGNVACVVTNCYCPQYSEDEKASYVTDDLVVEVRTYGEATGVTITSCYKKEQ